MRRWRWRRYRRESQAPRLLQLLSLHRHVCIGRLPTVNWLTNCRWLPIAESLRQSADSGVAYLGRVCVNCLRHVYSAHRLFMNFRYKFAHRRLIPVPDLLLECKNSAIWQRFPLISAYCMLNVRHISTSDLFDLQNEKVCHTRRPPRR